MMMKTQGVLPIPLGVAGIPFFMEKGNAKTVTQRLD